MSTDRYSTAALVEYLCTIISNSPPFIIHVYLRQNWKDLYVVAGKNDRQARKLRRVFCSTAVNIFDQCISWVCKAFAEAWKPHLRETAEFHNAVLPRSDQGPYWDKLSLIALVLFLYAATSPSRLCKVQPCWNNYALMPIVAVISAITSSDSVISQKRLSTYVFPVTVNPCTDITFPGLCVCSCSYCNCCNAAMTV